MTLEIYQVDAFTSELYHGNPAAVVPLKNWIPEKLMQSIAAENNLAETAFFVKEGEHYDIRWYTPTHEVPLCGHATLASAFVLFEELGVEEQVIQFNSKSGLLHVSQNKGWITLNFPSNKVVEVNTHYDAEVVFGQVPRDTYWDKNDYLLFEFDSESDILKLKPNFFEMLKWNQAVIMATAQGENCDFVSRVFAPKIGINEDPVTGSAHTRLIPYWSNKLRKKVLNAQQLSKRAGVLKCQHLGNRVEITGQAVMFLKGVIFC